ncbi:MAG: NADH dehydrogenase [Nitrospirae bacterium GWC2_42_7]|nr:MAG: NADH dehydrogenase [Nitrospirae bacterium GWC2_42_7]
MEKSFNKILKSHKESNGSIISLLQQIQNEFGYIPEKAVFWFSNILDIPASRFFGTATFYAQFNLKPRGKNIITACCGTACHVRGGDRLINNIKNEIGLSGEEKTTGDRKFTLEQVACVGACSAAPVVIINEKVYGKITPEKLKKEIKALKES